MSDCITEFWITIPMNKRPTECITPSILPSTSTITSNNEVSALNIINSGGAGVTSTLLGAFNFDLNCLHLINNAGGGIPLTNARGDGHSSVVNALNNCRGH